MYQIYNDMLYKKNNFGTHEFHGSWKIVVPRTLREKVLYECHDSDHAAHGGTYKTIFRLRQDYFWPGMKRDVLEYVRKCERCKITKPANSSQRAYMGNDRTPRKKFRMVSLDFIGPMPVSSKGNQYMLVLIDNFTKFVCIQPMRRATTEKTIELIRDQWISKYGCPETIVLDNGPQLRAKALREFAEKNRINLWYTANYHPQPNATEAVNHTIVKAIRCYTGQHGNHKRWDAYLQTIACALNSAAHSATDMPPYVAVFGENIAQVGADHRIRLIDDAEEDMPTPERFGRIRQHILAALKAVYEKRYNLRARNIEYKAGDVVYKRNFRLSKAAGQ